MRRAKKVPENMANPDGCVPPPPPMPPDMNIGMVAKEAERPRNRAADIVKLEALYIALDGDLWIDDWGAMQTFKAALARRITDLRLRH